ncbi:MAG TPA: patatin-like phospholipase family protein [Pyrinomonadaceae bacterium]|nr:patatin-like phospholipase family protein [Pyrinomonadaceae bacterium]
MDDKHDPFNILSLDGGGSKGIYTLGVLSELEQKFGVRLCDRFDLIYGTSTGAIIGAMLALGKSVEEIREIYFKIIPAVMPLLLKKRRGMALKKHAHEIFERKTFRDFETGVGIVAMDYDSARPMVFKSDVRWAHGSRASFNPGFGCTIADAVLASSAAYPILPKVILKIPNQGWRTFLDGGVIANNPMLLAIADAINANGRKLEEIRVLSLGTGMFPERPLYRLEPVVGRFGLIRLTTKLIVASTNTVEGLSRILFPNTRILRINEAFGEAEFRTNMREHRIDVLETLYGLGRRSFGKFEREIDDFF